MTAHVGSAAHPRVAVIVLGAGSGTRLGRPEPKAFVAVGGRTTVERALEPVYAMREPVQVVVAVPAAFVDVAQGIVREVEGWTPTGTTVTVGGATRQASVAAALDHVDQDVEVVLVHDAARPLTPTSVFDAVAARVLESGTGAVPGLPVTDTIKRVGEDDELVETLVRQELVAVQTPQGFPRAHLVAAHAAASGEHTDDAALVAAAGFPVHAVPGDPRSLKITTEWDLRRAEALLSAPDPGSGSRPLEVRVGSGTDVHAFDATRPLWLAGLHWPEEAGLAGHSDGDAVCHAICDALLAAARLGDIGGVFGTDDARFAEARGEVFLTATREKLEAAGFEIGNVTVQVVGNRPKLAPRRAEAESLLSTLLGAPVSVAATTSDGLGFTGRGEGVAATATAIVREPSRTA